MFRRSNSVHIDAPLEAIFDYVSNFTRHPEWAHEKIEIESVEGTGPGAPTFMFRGGERPP